VRADGDQPRVSTITRTIWAAVRDGSSARNTSASSNSAAGVRASAWRAAGTSASNPPAR